ncbi:serine/threonine-protein kinase Smg1 [Drosophila madeirensis]|uniref:non-specific serine/threonine protein kinase n=1 Tax=Drosophila madeirensis TaxID=30013 RepID=A0AAU9G4Z3_DROMD
MSAVVPSVYSMRRALSVDSDYEAEEEASASASTSASASALRVQLDRVLRNTNGNASNNHMLYIASNSYSCASESMWNHEAAVAQAFASAASAAGSGSGTATCTGMSPMMSRNANMPLEMAFAATKCLRRGYPCKGECDQIANMQAGNSYSSNHHLGGNSDDLRLTKIIRRLHTETNSAAALELCSKLAVAVRTPLNMAYMARSFDLVLESMLMLYKHCAPPVLEECSKTLGLMGYLNRLAYPIYEEFIVKNYRTCKRMQHYLIVALRTTLSLDTSCDLHLYSEKMMLMLKDFLESAESADSFMDVSSAIVQFSHSYRHPFECHFTDVVDIIIGWQLEQGQPKRLRSHCAQVLEQLTPFFSKQIDFSYGLLAQFVEDITVLGDEHEQENDRQRTESWSERLGAFVGAFNTLLKCAVRMQIFQGHPDCESIVKVAVDHITRIMPSVLLHPDADADALININELLSICLLHNCGGTLPSEHLEKVLLGQFESMDHLSEPQRQSALYLLLCTVRRLRVRLPASLVQLIFQSGPDGHPYVAAVRRQTGGAAYKMLLRTCQETLLIKNVPLLQQAYGHLVKDIDVCIQELREPTPSQTPLGCDEAEIMLIFHLAALAALAKQTSAIIGLYACQPSILRLLICNCRAQDVGLWAKHPTTHQALLGLLVVHCQANHNFRTNSTLFREPDPSKENISPTAHSFECILRFLDNILTKAGRLATENLKQLLQWTQLLLSECREQAPLLLEQEHFLGICHSIGGVAAKWRPLESAACMQAVLDFGPEALRSKQDLLVLYRETALQQLQVLTTSGHAPYAQIYAHLPLHMTLFESGLQGRRVCVWQQKMSQCSAVRDNVFQQFVEHLQRPEQEQLTHCLRELFVRSYQVAPPDERQEKLSQCTRRCQRLAAAWLQFEAARYCVDQRLRTTLGKPQETFLGFEAVIMRHARLLSGCAKEAERSSLGGLSLEQLTSIQVNLSMLLGFLDALEKLIYNAAEGSAFALRPPEKPVAAFFRLNNPTCTSWFNRIRIGVVIIAMHIHQPELVIRYAQQILMTTKTQDATYSQALVYLAWAWISCQEADSLRGLYVWARAKCSSGGKSYQWLQHAAEQAAGRREAALSGYQSVLAAEGEGQELEPHTHQFVLAQMMQCLQDTGQWSLLVDIKQHKLLRPEDKELNPFLQCRNVDVTALERLLARNENCSSANNSEELDLALQQLSLWPNHWESGASHSHSLSHGHASFSNFHVRRRLEDIMLQKTLVEQQPIRLPESQACHLMDLHWRESLLNPSSDKRACRELILLKHIVQGLASRQELSLLPLIAERRRPTNISSDILIRCLAWTQLLRQHCATGSWETLCLDAAAAARDEGNLQTCQSLLTQYYGQPLEEITLSGSDILDTQNAEVLRSHSELAKCLHLQQTQTPCSSSDLGPAINVCASLCLSLHRRSSHTHQDMGAGLLLTLSEWISARSSCNGNAMALAPNLQSPAIDQLLEELPECPLTRGSSSTQLVAIPQGERLVARLIHASLEQRPNCEEALIAYGNWSYRWGKKIVDSGSVLSQSDVAALSRALDRQTPLESERLNELLQALSMEQPPAGCVEVCPEAAKIRDDEASKSCLRRLSLLECQPDSVLDEILRIWRQAIANTYDFYKDAARSYFQYLSIKAGACQGRGASGAGLSSCQKGDARFQVDDSNLVTTTLRLLRLIVKHASGLQDVLEQGLRTTPIAPWKVIIPQLFSRLYHHEPYVRKSVCALLCRLAESRPQLVIFPAVVGANREKQQQQDKEKEKDKDKDKEKAKEKEKEKENDEPKDKKNSCYGYLLGALSKQAPEAVQHVQLMVEELRRVCLLWDEYWIHSLAHIYNTYVGRVNAFATEFKPDDHEGKNNRFNSWRPQLLLDLEALVAFTARAPETSYERSFRKRFDVHIKSTLEVLRTRRYPEAWEKLKQLYHTLQANMIRGTAMTLKMQTVSPVLCGIGRMRISMPGLDEQESYGGDQEPDQVHIESVEGTVCILPTKTKPKKVAFYGSNGQRYTFLFKGLEDLHLDERIMQFLSISNAIMACRSDQPRPGGATTYYRAHHYSVIPLGPQSGLISWVDGVTPLFALYKKWQQRQPAPSPGGGGGVGGAPSHRFTDLFYNKLTPLLAKSGLSVNDPRRQWPIAALRQVLGELSDETPSDLLARELWCQSGNAAEWRQSVRRYSACMSVMSMIGYVIGLGDRHLDNVLINLGSGDIVHIDYNVCFEKGRTLRIPEKVPFRLTQNLINALGITGIEGAFRLGCEYVLKVMRKERETLLTLLEAFVYDPLVDWTLNDDAQTQRRSINPKQSENGGAKCHKNKDKAQRHRAPDWEAKRPLFTDKLAQLHKFWSTNEDEILLQLQEVGQELGNLEAAQAQRLAAERELEELNERSALVAEIKSLGPAMKSHSFNTAPLRLQQTRKHLTALMELTVERRADFAFVQCLLASYSLCLQPYHLSQMHAQLQSLHPVEGSWHEEHLALADVLQMYVPGALLASIESTRTQVDSLLVGINEVARHCADLMQQYAAVMAFYPNQCHRQNLMVRFHDSYAAYLQLEGAVDLAANSPSICTQSVTNLAETLEVVWLHLGCQLHDSAQRLSAKQVQILSLVPPTSTATFLQRIQQSDCSLLLLNSCLMRTLNMASASFRSYEAQALDEQDKELLQHQLRYIHVIRSMCHGVMGARGTSGDDNDQQEQDLYLGQLETLLAALMQLQRLFAYDLPASIFRQLLLQPNLDQLEELSKLGPKRLQQLYSDTLELAEQRHKATSEQQRFMLSLQPIHQQFQLVATLLDDMRRCLKQRIEDISPTHAHQYLELVLFKEHNLELSDNCFFRVIHRTLGASSSCDVREMARPMGTLVHCIQKKCLEGLLPLAAHDYFKGYGSTCQPPENTFTSLDVEKADHLCGGLFMALQTDAGLMQQEQEVALISQQIELHSLVGSAQFWGYSEALGAQLRGGPHIICRRKLVTDIGQSWGEMVRTVDGLEQLLLGLDAQLGQLEALRSNWNRNHIDSMLRNAQEQRRQVADQVALVRQLSEGASAVCHLEQVVADAVGSGLEMQTLHNHLEQWLAAFGNWKASCASVSGVEQAVVELLDPEDGIDDYWLQNVHGLIEEQTCKVQREFAILSGEQQAKLRFICTLLKETQRLLEHVPRFFVGNFCSNAKAMGHGGKGVPADVQQLCDHLRDSQLLLQSFLEHLTALRKDLCAERHILPTELVAGWRSELQQIQAMAGQEASEYFKRIKELLLQVADSDSLTYDTFTYTKGAANLHEQKRNAYGVSVWKKIRMKLEGRDPDGSQRSSIAEQVDHVISDATNPDNLAVLYEGWTPWV